MGKPAAATMRPPPPQQYRDDVDADAVSMHTTRDDYDYDDAPQLPSYTDSEAAASTTADGRLPTSLPRQDEYAVLQPPAPLSRHGRATPGPVNICETTIRMDARLNDPEALYGYIWAYLSVLPPRPAVRLQGWHHQTVRRNNKKETERVIDFDLVFYLCAHLPTATPAALGMGDTGGWQPRIAANGDSVHRGSWRKTRASGHTQDIEVGGDAARRTLAQWCEDYCADKAALKIFRVTRDVPGLDREYLRNQLDVLARSTQYRGHVEVTFPIAEKHVDIYSAHVVNRWRIGWVRWLFYLSFLWIFTWPILFFLTKRWDVYTVDWCYSWSAPQRSGPDGGTVVKKKYHGMTEQMWFAKHAQLIKGLVVEGWQGDATNLPLNTRRGEEGRSSGTGNADVDAAVSLIRGGLGAWNAVSGRDTDGWGADST
ncbi:hypothetical protein LTR08_007385 [Meristemomyces frigidus]|nr:hypothetical protein LTR08_007385 [Meristemomyces frigidus]